MATFFTLLRYNRQGITSVKEAPKRVEARARPTGNSARS